MSENPSIAVAEPRPRQLPRTILQQVISRTFVRWTARVGILWIIILVVLAVFAPFIANSNPFLIKLDGQWSSPMFQTLTAPDVILPILFFAGVILLAIDRLRFSRKLLIFIGVLVVITPLAFLLVSPPASQVYERYRERAEAGRVEFVLNAPIPYSPSDRLRDDPSRRLTQPFWASAAISHNHWLGTEVNGSDIASRMIHACRIALAVGFIATGIALIIGIIIGCLMGYFSGIVDLIGMRIVEIFEFIPTLFLLLMFVAFFDRNIYMMMAIIGLTSWAGYARFIRAEFLKLRKQDFVQAAIASGLPLRSILFRHMLPNGLAPVLVSASFGVAGAILAEATLSFLGLG
ncbi:MAG: ABC transporter permease, partial [Phycisphaeraceae bacterium]